MMRMDCCVIDDKIKRVAVHPPGRKVQPTDVALWLFLLVVENQVLTGPIAIQFIL